MPRHPIAPIIRHLRTTLLRRDEAGLSDGYYLERFIADHDAAAFEALVRRHGRMVLGVCRRILDDPHDADDCFQATFLVLVRKAASISPPEKVGNWLYGVAQTTAIRVKAANAKRRRREKPMSQVPDREDMQADLGGNWQGLLDVELARLPDKYRMAIVLCDLEGRSRKEVAGQLRIPEGTLSSRLTTARRLLGKRLARRGLVVSVSWLTATLTRQSASASLPASLIGSTLKAALAINAGETTAAGIVCSKVVALTEGVLKTMLWTKIKMATATTLLVAFIAGGAGLLYQIRAEEPRQTSDSFPRASREPKRPTAADKQATTSRPSQSKGTVAKPEADSWQVKIEQNPQDYFQLFDDLLDVVDDFFEVAYANRYEGRIETKPQPLLSQPNHLRRRAIVSIVIADEGGYVVSVHVPLEVDEQKGKRDEKKPSEVPAETQWDPIGRDTMLEQVILRKMRERDRGRRAEATRKRPAKETEPDRQTHGGDRSNRIVLKNVSLESINKNRTISLITLENGATSLVNVAVPRDATLAVKGGNTFAHLKIGMRVILELQVRENRLVVTAIQQEGLSRHEGRVHE